MENFIFGLRPVLEAIKSGQNIDKVLIKKGLSGELAGEVLKEVRKQNIFSQYVPYEKLDKICDKNHQGIIAYISPIKYYDLETIVTDCLDQGKSPLIVLLDSITDVRNFGAIARSCECAGVNAIVLPAQNSVRVTEDAIKTSAGALYNMPICISENLIDSILLLDQLGIKVFALTEKSNESIYDSNFNKPMAIILGSEDNGISPQILKRVSHKIKIPMFGKTESLNVSVSAAVTIYEVIRQRLKA